MNYDVVWPGGSYDRRVHAHLCKPLIPVWPIQPCFSNVCVPGPALICEMHTESQCGGNRGHCFPEDRLAARAINYKRQGDRQLAS